MKSFIDILCTALITGLLVLGWFLIPIIGLMISPLIIAVVIYFAIQQYREFIEEEENNKN